MFQWRQRAPPDEKAIVMKELPSDIWHPLLLLPLNLEIETVGRGNDGLICQQAKWHSVTMLEVNMLYVNISSHMKKICEAAQKSRTIICLCKRKNHVKLLKICRI